jgi:hypothetical protein
MNRLILILAFACIPLVTNASQNTNTSDDAWVVDDVLYSDENCGEPIGYVDDQGNFLAGFPSLGQTNSGSE